MYGKRSDRHIPLEGTSGADLTASLLIQKPIRRPTKPQTREDVQEAAVFVMPEIVEPKKIDVPEIPKIAISPEKVDQPEDTVLLVESPDPQENTEAEVKEAQEETRTIDRSGPVISKKVLKVMSAIGFAALSVLGAEIGNSKVLPAHERAQTQSEIMENRGLLIKVMDQTAGTMALMREDQSVISTKKTISVYYDAPKNLLYSKIGLDKGRLSEKVLEFEGQLFLNNRATGEGNIWFGERQILVSLDNYEGASPDNKCNIPGVPKSSCMTGLVLFDLNFEGGQIKSVAFSTLVGNKNASNADSSGHIGTVNSGKRSLDILLTDADLLSRIKTLYATYKALTQITTTGADAKKDGLSVNFTKSESFQKRLLDGTVVYDFVSSNGNRDSCAGFVYANDVIVTAKHCLTGVKNDSNGALLENVMSINKDKNDVVRQSSIWNRGSSKYQYAFSAYKDLGVIVFDRAALTKAKPLSISERIITEEDRFIFGHVVKTDGKKYWRSEVGSALTQRDNYDVNDPYWLKFAFGLQKGNSGGATVDTNGDVVSVLRNYCDYDEATSNGKFCGDRVTKKDVTTLIAEARKKLAELDK